MSNAFAKDQLKSFIERIERLEAEKATIAADIKEIYAEARGCGFSTKTMRQIVKDRAKDKADFDEEQALLELYRGALGLLYEPLSDNARRHASGQPPKDAPKDAGNETPDTDGATQKPADTAPTAEAVETARAEGTEAAKTGKKVTENPYVYGDPRRMAWDEGWCMGSCSDGMDIPDAWRRKSKKKKPDDAGADKDDTGGKDAGDADGAGDAP